MNDLGDGNDDVAALDRLVNEITGGARGDDERLRAFRRALEEHVALPLDAFVVGAPVSLIGFSYDGNTRRGLTATCRRPDGALHGYGLCCWRLGRFEEADRTFERMLWLNPADNQGARFLIAQVHGRVEWTDGE